MRFADIPGHDDVKERLRRMADEDHIPHALLLEGPDGAGKFALARAFVQYVHCTARTPDGDSCGMCPSCRQHEAFGNIDTVYSFPVLKKNSKPTISDDYIEEFHELMTESPFMDFERWLSKLDNANGQPQIYVEEGNELIRRLSFMTRQSKYKLAVIWLPERLKIETANKLLKLVEEPFDDTKFVMVSNESRKILPTIYSRTQRIEVKRYSDAELAAILTSMGVDEAAAADLSRIAEGNVNLALRLATVSKERLRHFELFVELMRKAYAVRVADLRTWANEVAALGREGAIQFVGYASRLVRESFLMHLAEPGILTMERAEWDFVAKFFPFVNEKNVEGIIALFDDAERDVAANANAKIVFFDLAVRMIMRIKGK